MSLLEDLAAELGIDAGALAAQLRLGAADSIAPSYLTQDAAGKVSAQFSGHVKAAGVDLPTAFGFAGDPSIETPPIDDSVRFLAADAVLMGLLYLAQPNVTNGSDAHGALAAIAHHDTAVDNPLATSALIALNHARTSYAAFKAQQSFSGGAAALVTAQPAGGGVIQRKVLAEDATSDFLQQPDWVAMNLSTGWQNYGFGTNAAAYAVLRQGLHGIIMLRGVINNGFLGNALAVGMPYFPSAQTVLATIGSAGLGRIDALPNGSLVPQAGMASGGAGSLNWLSLDGLWYAF